MSRRIKLGFNGSGDSNGTAVASKASKGVNTNSFTQSTSSRKPTAKSRGNAHATLNSFLTTASCDGGDVMSLASTETLANNSTYTIIVAWTNGDYTNDTWLISGTSNDAHWGIKAGGADVIYKADGSKGSAGERDYVINSTVGSTTAYTFGSDVEMLAIVMDGTGSPVVCDIYNIDGAKIADAVQQQPAGLTVSFPIDHIIGKSDGTLGLNGELINIEVYNTALSASIIKGLGNKYKLYKNA